MKKGIFRTICSFTVATAMVLTATACSSSQPAEQQGEEQTQQQSEDGEQIKIGVLQLMEHDALDNARKGFVDALAEGGYVDGEKIVSHVSIILVKAIDNII